jgi:hypothetical protein
VTWTHPPVTHPQATTDKPQTTSKMLAGLDKKKNGQTIETTELLPPIRSGLTSKPLPKPINASESNDQEIMFRINELNLGSIVNFRDALALLVRDRNTWKPLTVKIDGAEYYIRPNVVFRCSTLDSCDKDDATELLERLNLRTIIDLRGGAEGDASIHLHTHFKNRGGKSGKDGMLAWSKRKEELGLMTFHQDGHQVATGSQFLDTSVKIVNGILGILPLIVSQPLASILSLSGLPFRVSVSKQERLVDFDLPAVTWNGPSVNPLPRSADLPTQDPLIDHGRFVYKFDFLSKPIAAQFTLQPWLFKLKFMGLYLYKPWRPDAMKMFAQKVLGTHHPGLAWLNRQILKDSGDLVRDAFEVILESCEENVLSEELGGAVVFHCSAGKDRTGFVNTLLLSILGVPTPLILGDYLRSEDELAGVVWFLEQEVIKQGLSPDWAHVEDAIMRDTLQQLYSTYKSPAHYLASIGFDFAKQQRLRDLLLIPVDGQEGRQVLDYLRNRELERDVPVERRKPGIRRGSLVPLEVNADGVDPTKDL